MRSNRGENATKSGQDLSRRIWDLTKTSHDLHMIYHDKTLLHFLHYMPCVWKPPITGPLSSQRASNVKLLVTLDKR